MTFVVGPQNEHFFNHGGHSEHGVRPASNPVRYSQPRRLKYQKGTIADRIIKISARG